MDTAGPAGGLLLDAVGQQSQAESVALAMQQFDEHSRSIYCKGQLVGMFGVGMSFEWKVHRAAMVDDQLATEVCFLFELFDIQTI